MLICLLILNTAKDVSESFFNANIICITKQDEPTCNMSITKLKML